MKIDFIRQRNAEANLYFIFKLIGWKIEGSFPLEIKKYIAAVAPHTSNGIL